MLEESFEKIYKMFKLDFYRKIFKRFQSREATLTAVETFCIEAIYDLGEPTISEFAEFAQISAPNAAYKVNSLVKKGYLKKVRSEDDHREYHLVATDRFMNYYNVSYQYVVDIVRKIEQRFTQDELNKLAEMLDVIADELMADPTRAA